MEEIFGLPAHPFMIHFPVVAIPVLAILAVVFVAVPTLRPKWRHALAVFAVVTTVSTIFAAGSGQALVDAIDGGESYDEFIDDHKTLGETLRVMVIGLAVTLLGLLYVAKPGGTDSTAKAINAAISLAVVVLSILSLIWVIRTGHAGTEAHWDGFI